jgi:acyl carrier protein
MSETATVIEIVRRSLQLGSRADSFSDSTALLGEIPEFDSMAVVTILQAIEEHYGVVIADDEVSTEVFMTVGALARFVQGKIAA